MRCLFQQQTNTLTIGDGGADAWAAVGDGGAVGGGGANTWLDESERSDELQQEQQLIWKKLQSVNVDKRTSATAKAAAAAKRGLILGALDNNIFAQWQIFLVFYTVTLTFRYRHEA